MKTVTQFEKIKIAYQQEIIGLCLHLKNEAAARDWAIKAGLISAGEAYQKNINWEESAAVYLEAVFSKACKMTVRATTDAGTILSAPDLDKAGRKAARKWKRNGIDGRDGREVPAEFFRADRLSANRPDDFDEWADNDEPIDDLNALDQTPFQARATFRASLLGEVREASRKISASVTARVTAATSGAARAAVKRSAGDEMAFLQGLEGFLTGRGGFDPQTYEDFFAAKGFETPLLRQKKCRLKKRLAEFSESQPVSVPTSAKSSPHPLAALDRVETSQVDDLHPVAAFAAALLFDRLERL